MTIPPPSSASPLEPESERGRLTGRAARITLVVGAALLALGAAGYLVGAALVLSAPEPRPPSLAVGASLLLLLGGIVAWIGDSHRRGVREVVTTEFAAPLTRRATSMRVRLLSTPWHLMWIGIAFVGVVVAAAVLAGQGADARASAVAVLVMPMLIGAAAASALTVSLAKKRLESWRDRRGAPRPAPVRRSARRTALYLWRLDIWCGMLAGLFAGGALIAAVGDAAGAAVGLCVPAVVLFAVALLLAAGFRGTGESLSDVVFASPRV